MTIQKIAIGSGIAVCSMALTATAAFANEIDGSNDTTGSHSSNTVDVNVSHSNSLNQSNSSNITNDITVHSDTGGNRANDNTGNGSVQTGPASAYITVSNTGNVNTAGPVPGGDEGGSIWASNKYTGSHSHNRVSSDVSSRNSLRQSNRSSIHNMFDVWNSTGHNSASDNTWDGSVDTGGTDANIDVLNDVNYNQ